MPVTSDTRPIEDSVAKVNDELAVGSDLEFQRRWESGERIIWIFLIIFLLLSLAGLFGRGPLAHAKIAAADGSMQVEYERFQRFGTPSVLTVTIDAQAIHNEHAQLWVSESLVRPLGNQRVIPQPDKSQIGNGGVLYTFPASKSPGFVEFQTQPSKVGASELKLRVPGHSELNLKIFVMP
ncbi:MAG: hypothetical protein ACJ746_05615 [Bryobacteraceae bacterium]